MNIATVHPGEVFVKILLNRFKSILKIDLPESYYRFRATRNMIDRKGCRIHNWSGTQIIWEINHMSL